MTSKALRKGHYADIRTKNLKPYSFSILFLFIKQKRLLMTDISGHNSCSGNSRGDGGVGFLVAAAAPAVVKFRVEFRR